jgi:DNA-binding Lrp family transcriptional regulator
MERLMADSASPLFLQFQRLSLEPFNPDASATLARKLLADLPAPADPAVIAEIRRLSGGHPYYVTQLCDRLARLALLAEAPVDATLARQAFLAEALSPSGGIYGFCKYVYDLSLQKAKGYGTIKTILRLLAEEEPLSIARIARRLRVSDPTAREYLRWLLEVDLIQEVEGGYAHRDPVLRFWVAHTAVGIEVGPFPKHEEVRDLLPQLEESLQRTATELGVAKESQIRELMEQFSGQQVDGAIFGGQGPVQLPHFRRVRPYRSADGQVEVDVLAEIDASAREAVAGEALVAGKEWAVEIKWRGRLAGKKELARLAAKAQVLGAQAWFISREGFTPDALAYARQAGILVSAREDTERLARTIGARSCNA